MEGWRTPALAARCPPRFCAVFLVLTLGGSTLEVISDLPLPRPAVRFILGIGGAKTGLGEDGGEIGSSLIGARSMAASSSPKNSTRQSDINLHIKLDIHCIRERLDQLSVPYFPRAVCKQIIYATR